MPSVKTYGKGRKHASSDVASGMVHLIGIAGLRVVSAPDRIRTVLGSCIGIALCDRATRIGAMGHIILPSSAEGSGDPGKFADSAIDVLLEQMADAGAQKERITAKIVGGAAMFGNDIMVGLGARNADAVTKRPAFHGIRLVASAVGGTKGRKMLLDPATGEVKVEIIGEAPQVI